MACKTVSWPPLPSVSEKISTFAPLSLPRNKISTLTPNCGRKLSPNHKRRHFARNCFNNGRGDFPEQHPPQDALLKAIAGISLPSLSLSNYRVWTCDCVLKAAHVLQSLGNSGYFEMLLILLLFRFNLKNEIWISDIWSKCFRFAEVSKRERRVGQTTIVVFGGSVSDDSTTGWLALDRKLNSYPRKRGFTAIGTGGDDFVQAMVYAVESVVQRPIPQGQVRQKISSRGKYVSVKIGPVQVASSEQVQAVYYAMRRDDRMKYFL